MPNTPALAESPYRFLAARSAPAALAAVAVSLLFVSGCGPGRALTIDLHADVRLPDPAVVLFLCDGLGADVVEQGCREGWLPNIERRFVTGGCRVTNATTCIPAITYGAIATLLTGTGPGTHAIVGNCWFDPEQVFFRDYATIQSYRYVNDDLGPPMVYELIQPAASVSIQAAHRRGVTKNIANWALSGVMWFFGDYTAVDKLTATSVWRVARWANHRREWPDLLTCYFPGADSVGHRFGAGSPQYRRAVEHLDYQVGRVCDWLETEGLLSTTYLVLVSDHGMVDVSPDGLTDLTQLVRDVWGRNATDRALQEGSAESRQKYFDRFDTVVAYHNGRGAFLYFRGPDGWHERPAPETVEAILSAPPPEAQLWNIDGVDLVVYLASEHEAVLRAGGGAARVLSRDGPDGPWYAYEPAPDDVLGYLDTPGLAAFVAAGFHPPGEWLHATADHVFPNVVPQLLPLLRVRQAGEVVVFAAPGYSFVRERGGHGGIRREELHIPLMFAGPGIEPGSEMDVARSVDLVPTVLDLLGLDVERHSWLEGVPLPLADRAAHLAAEGAAP